MRNITKNQITPLNLNHRYSLLEIILFFTLIYSLFVIYSLYQQVDFLNLKILELQKSLSEISLRINEQNSQFLALSEELRIYKNLSPENNADFIKAKNEQTQFYIKTAGVVLLITITILGLTKISGITVFSLKTWIPASFYSTLQNYIPYLQNVKTYAFEDKEHSIVYTAYVNMDSKDNTMKLFANFSNGTDKTPKPISEFVNSIISKFSQISNSKVGVNLEKKEEVVLDVINEIISNTTSEVVISAVTETPALLTQAELAASLFENVKIIM